MVGCFLLGVLRYQYPFYFSRAHICKAPRRLLDAEEYRDLLRKYTSSQRALPNQRLATAFGVGNAFATTDSTWHAKFVKDAKEKIRTTDTEWKDLVTAADALITERISRLSTIGSVSIQLVPFVQIIVFNIAMGDGRWLMRLGAKTCLARRDCRWREEGRHMRD